MINVDHDTNMLREDVVKETYAKALKMLAEIKATDVESLKAVCNLLVAAASIDHIILRSEEQTRWKVSLPASADRFSQQT